MRVLLQNTSDHAIRDFGPNAILIDGSFLSIKGPSGQELPQKEHELDFSGSIRSIEPGEVSDDLLRVDFLYDLRQPGRYILQLKLPIAEDRSLPDYGADGFISSNVITLTVSTETVRPSPPFTLTLTGQETFVSGSDVSAKAVMKNTSDQDIFLVTDPDGRIDDRYYRLETIVAPNNARFTRGLGHFGRSVIRTISPGATLEAMLDKQALGFDADWILPTIYHFQLIYPATADLENALVASNVPP